MRKHFLPQFLLWCAALCFLTTPHLAQGQNNCQDPQWLATACYVNGDPLAGGTAGTFDAFVIFESTNTGESTPPQIHLPGSQVGSVWGVALNPRTTKIYTSSVLKRHVGFGPGGIGAIYEINPNAAVPAANLYVDLGALGVNVGTNPRTPSSGVVDDANELPADADLPSWDVLAFDLVGKTSIGGIDISDDGNTMYAINLFQKELVILNVAGAPSLTGTFAIPDPGCSDGEFRPWAVKYHNGKVYVGVVCSAETSQQTSDLQATIYEFDGSSFTEVFSFPLDYPRGIAGGGNGQLIDPAEWLPWTSTFQSVSVTSGVMIYPQPILSDIEFDDDGSMIVAFMDRNGNQVGNANYPPDINSASINSGQTAGDILRIGLVNGNYELENNGQINGVQAAAPACFGGPDKSGFDNQQGPGGGEYYWADNYIFNPCNTEGDGAGVHQETCFGGIAFIPGSGYVMMSSMDPTQSALSGGVAKLNNITGKRVINESDPFNPIFHGYRLYDATTPGSFSKAVGLGDLEAFCKSAAPPACDLAVTATPTNATCAGSPTGSCDLLVTGNLNPVTYTWSNGANTSSITSLQAGAYTVTITESLTCSLVEVVNIDENAAIVPNCIANATTGVGFNDGSASVTAVGGVGVYSYLWSTGATSDNIVNLVAGTYTVTITDGEGCSATCESEVNEPGCVMTVSLTPTALTCNGNSSGQIQSAVIGNSGNFVSAWSNVTFDQNLSNVQAGTYTVTVTDIAGCSATASATVIEPAQLSVNCSATNVTSIGGADGTASLSATGGTAGYTYLWSNGQTDASISGLPAGTYTVTVTDANLCPAQCQLVISAPSCNLDLNIDFSNVTCNGANDGTAGVNVAGANGAVSYLWSNGETIAQITDLAPGTYEVTVSDELNCIENAIIFITEPTVLDVACSGTGPTAPGFSNGSVSVNATGGTGVYTYLWSNGSTTSAVFSIPAGVYTVTVTDENGCEAVCSQEIKDPACTLTVNGVATDETCFDANNGGVNLTVTGDFGGFNVLWSNGTTIADILFLNAGTYTVTVTDGANCTATASYVIQQPDALVLNCTGTDISVPNGSDGTATANVSGGTPDYTYLWSNGATTSSITGLTAGTYTCTVTDEVGCTATCQSSLTAPDCALTLSVQSGNNDCFGQTNGLVGVYPAGNFGAVSYAWSNGATTFEITGLAAGTYTVTATDAAGCTAVTAYTVTTPSEIQLSCSATDATAPGYMDGTVIAMVSGGTPNYTYEWSNGSTSLSLIGVGAGTYTLTVTDENGCTATCQSTVDQPECDLGISSSLFNESCNELNNGSITIQVDGNFGTFAANWSNGASGTTISGLSAGIYTVTVNDQANCTATTNFLVKQPESLTIDCQAENVTIPSGSDGSITTVVTGGTEDYSYLWSNGATTATITGLSEGTYTCTVTDANNCQAICSSAVNAPDCNLSLGVQSDNNDCFGQTNGLVGVYPAGNFGAVSYAWSNGATTFEITDLAAGTYTVTATDAAGCSAVTSVTITTPSNINLSCSATDATAPGFMDGSVIAMVSGGTPNYTYQWSNGSTSLSLIGVGAGTYTLTVTDENGCTATCQSTVDEPSCSLSISTTNIQDETCNEANNGIISIAVAGNFGTFAANWSNGATGTSITGLSAGIYTVTVNDQANCQAMTSYQIEQPDLLSLNCSATSVTTPGGTDGSISTTVTGGTPAYDYLWSNGATTSSISGLSAGTYTCTVTDDNGCTAVCSSAVNAPDCNLSLGVQSDNNDCFGQTNGLIGVYPAGNFGAVSYAWSNGATTFEITDLAAGTYTVTATDAAGCSAITSITITSPSNIDLTCSATDATAPGFMDGSVIAMVSGGTPNYTYMWSNGSTSLSLVGVGAGTYTITVTDENGCTATCQSTIDEPACSLQVNTSGSSETCNTPNNGTALANVTGAFGGVSYLWSNGVTMSANTGLAAGTYTVTATDEAGCQATSSYTVGAAPIVTADCSATNVTTPNGANGTAQVLAAGGTGAYQYLWSNGETSSMIMGLSAGTYTVTVTNPSTGCSSSCQVNITAPACNLQLAVNKTDVTCAGANDGTITATPVNNTGNVTYEWSNGATSVALWGLAGGTYSVTATDAAGCTFVGSYIVNEPTQLIIACAGADQSTSGVNDASASVSAVGGTPGYSYLWSNGATTANITGLAPGTYTVTVSDSKQCSATCEVLLKPAITPDCEVLNTHNVTMALFGLPTQSGLYYEPASSGLFVSQLDQTSALMSGTIVNKLNANQRWNVNFKLVNKQTANQWTSAGNMLMGDVNGCNSTDQSQWQIWEIDDNNSTLIGTNDFAGQVLNIYDIIYPNGDAKRSFVQIGLGAGVITCENSIGAWFAFQGTHTGTGDFYAHLDCEVDPVDPVDPDTVAVCKALNTHNVTMAMFGVPDQSGLYYEPATSGLFVTLLDQAVAEINGVIVNKLNPNQQWSVNFKLKNKQSASDWTSAGNMLMGDVNGCNSTDQSLWQIWQIDANTSTITGLADFAGRTLNVYDIVYPNGDTKRSFVQIGLGAGVITCENSMGVWLGFQGTHTGTADFYTHIDCEDVNKPELPKVEVCNLVNGHNFNHVLLIGNRKYKVVGDGLMLVKPTDGNARLTGVVQNIQNANDRYELAFNLSPALDYATWTAQGQLAPNTSCANADADNWIFRGLMGGSKLTGIGANAGKVLNVHTPKKQGVSQGEGVNGLCGNGLAARLRYTGSETTTGMLRAGFDACAMMSCGGEGMPDCNFTQSMNLQLDEEALIEEVDFTMYPNPANAKVNIDIQGLEGQEIAIQILDMTGRVVLEDRGYFEGTQTMQVGHLPIGVYAVRITGNQSEPVTRLLQIKH